MTAIDAFHTKQAAFETLHRSDWHIFAHGFISSIKGEVPGVMPGDTPFETGDQLTKHLVQNLNMAEIFYIAPMMNRLVTAAAESWEEDEPVLAEDFPSQHGWFYVPSGLALVDVRGQIITTSAISWAIRGSRVQMVWWANKHLDAPHIKQREHWSRLPVWSPWHLGHLTLGEPLPLKLGMGMVLPPEVSEGIQYHEQGNSIMMTYPKGYSPDELAEAMTLEMRTDHTSAWLVAALRIMQQPLASTHRQGLPANVRKALRGKVQVKQKAITVIEFRHHVGEYQHGEREFTHRFLRRGHWRQQPYKRADGEWDRRRIWIHATIVGDPSLPLVLREHVNALVR